MTTPRAEQAPPQPMNPASSRRYSRWLPDVAGVIAGNAGSWFSATAVTSGLGAVFWALATHHFSRSAVGLASAAISAMGLIASIATLGLNTMLMGELHGKEEKRWAITSASLILSGAVGASFGCVYALVVPLLSEQQRVLSSSALNLVVFVSGCALTALTMVLDQALLGALRGRLQLARNAAFAIVKLGLLVAFAGSVGKDSTITLMFLWVLSLPLSGVVFLRRSKTSHFLRDARPDFGAVRQLRWAALGHHAMNLAVKAPTLALPIIVVGVLSPQANATFYVAWMIAGFVWTLAGSLAGVLYAVGASDEQALAERLRFTMGVSAILTAAATLVIVIGARPILAVFGTAYIHTGVFTLRIVISGSLFVAVKYHFLTLTRIRRRVSNTVVYFWCLSLGEMGAAAAGGLLGGLPGLSLGWLIAVAVEAALLAPSVFGAMRTQERLPDFRVKEGLST